MATGVQSIVRVTEAADFPPTTVDRSASFLQRAEPRLWPLSGKGGGRAAVHVEPHHLVNLILALVAAQPSDAERAVALLRKVFAQDEEPTGGRS